MTLSFYKYFIRYIIHSKTRQRLLFLAVVGLFLSSFALLVVQSIMSGLQKNLVGRSKNVYGAHTIHLKDFHYHSELIKIFEKHQVDYIPEFYIELLLKDDGFVTPVVAHGLDLEQKLPTFLEDKDFTGPVVGADLGTRLKGSYWQQIELISPVHVDSFVGDIPRRVSEQVSDYVMTELAEVDRFHIWMKDKILFNLIREQKYNRYRLYQGQLSAAFKKDFKSLHDKSQGAVYKKSWEQNNAPLVWALNLERFVMVLLFTGMTLLVAISITSGLLIFFSKIKIDLLSFWILGMGRKQLMNLAMRFTILVNSLTCISGLLIALLFLWLLEYYAPDIMPAIFVERKLPVDVSLSGVFISFSIPFGISTLFSFFTFKAFRKEHSSFLQLLRSVA